MHIDPTPTTTTTTNVAHYDERLARDIDERERLANVAQRERDARRADYDASMDNMPIMRAMRDLRNPTSRSSQSGWAPRPPRPHKNTRMVAGPNAWESNSDHARTHLTPDRACHHPLVVCHHKW